MLCRPGYNKEGTPRILIKCSIIGMLPLLENKGLGHLVKHYCGDLKGCSRRSLTMDLKSLFEEKRKELSVKLQKMLVFTMSNDHSLTEQKERRFRCLEQDRLVLQQIGKPVDIILIIGL
jgi:hypothetical protein